MTGILKKVRNIGEHDPSLITPMDRASKIDKETIKPEVISSIFTRTLAHQKSKQKTHKKKKEKKKKKKKLWVKK